MNIKKKRKKRGKKERTVEVTLLMILVTMARTTDPKDLGIKYKIQKI